MAFRSTFRVAASLAMVVVSASAALTMEKVGGYDNSENEDEPLEVVAIKASTNHIFVTSKTGVTIFELGDGLSPSKIGSYTSTESFGDTTSVAYNPRYDELAITVKPEDLLTKGKVHIVSDVRRWLDCDCCEDYVQVLETGYGPDMVTFTPDGKRILIANEGEPEAYDTEGKDPIGSISIFKYDNHHHYFREACEVGFEKFDESDRTERLVEGGMRVGGGEFTTFSMDMEPEYIAVTDNSETAYVTLQENNAVVKIDIRRCKVNRMYPLGYKDWGDGMLVLDASDEDGDEDSSGDRGPKINLENWPNVKGMYQPDAVTTFKARGKRYFLTANEGAPREVEAGDYDEVERAKKLAEEFELNEDFGDAIYKNKKLGRLEVTTEAPFTGEIEDDIFSDIYTFGGRSISIFDGKSGELVWDSGDFIETFIANEKNGFSGIFNSNGDEESFDTRSDKRGPEPEGLVMLEVDHRIYVFVALERAGGWMCWDVSDPQEPVFQSYTNSYKDDSDVGFFADVAPESGAILPARDSPGGQPLLIAAYEESNTLAVFEISTDH